MIAQTCLRVPQRQVANRRETVIGCTKIVCGIPLIGMNLAVKVTGQSWFWLELFPTECDNVSYGFTLLFVSLQLGMAFATSCWWYLYRDPPQVGVLPQHVLPFTCPDHFTPFPLDNVRVKQSPEVWTVCEWSSRP
jgi:hypothetical protein